MFKVKYTGLGGYGVSRTFATQEAAQQFIDYNAMVYPLPNCELVDVTPRGLTSVDQYNRMRNAMTDQFIAGNMTEAHWQWQYTIYQAFVNQLEGWSFGAYRW